VIDGRRYMHNGPVRRDARIGVVGATGAVGSVTVQLLRERGYENLRLFASPRSAGRRIGDLEVEEATSGVLEAGDLDVCLFSVGASASRELVPHALAGGATAIDKSAAYRLQDGVPLVVPEVNAARALEHDGIVANPNCCAIPLTVALKPLHDAAGLARVRVATYQSVSGAGARRMEQLRSTPPGEADLAMDWNFDGVEFEEESKLRAETRKILDLPDLPISATTVRVPVLIGHAEAIWIETEDPLAAEQAREVLGRAPGIKLEEQPTPGMAAGIDAVLVGRIRRDASAENGLALFVVCDNLRKGAALNAIQIAELLLDGRASSAHGLDRGRGRRRDRAVASGDQHAPRPATP
jgi:aspartate-semialdehyde dehydrogenase